MGLCAWRVIGVTVIVLFTRDNAVSQTAEVRVCHTFRIRSFNEQAPPKELESEVRTFLLEHRSQLNLASDSDVAPADVDVTIQSDPAAAAEFRIPAPSDPSALDVRYAVVAHRGSDVGSVQTSGRTVAGNWKAVAGDVVSVVTRLCPGSMAAAKPVPHLPSEAPPLTVQQHEALASARVVGVETKYRWLDMGSLVAAMNAGAKASGLAVDSVQVETDQHPVDATITVGTLDELLWSVEISRDHQTVERHVVATRQANAIAKMARTSVQVFCEVSCAPRPVPARKQEQIFTADAHARVLSGPFAGVGERVRLHVGDKSFAVYNGDGRLLFSVPVDHVLDVSVASPEFQWYGLDSLTCGGEECMALPLAEALGLPMVVGRNIARKYVLDVAWREGDVIKTASLELRPAKKLANGLGNAAAHQP